MSATSASLAYVVAVHGNATISVLPGVLNQPVTPGMILTESSDISFVTRDNDNAIFIVCGKHQQVITIKAEQDIQKNCEKLAPRTQTMRGTTQSEHPVLVTPAQGLVTKVSQIIWGSNNNKNFLLEVFDRTQTKPVLLFSSRDSSVITRRKLSHLLRYKLTATQQQLFKPGKIVGLPHTMDMM